MATKRSVAVTILGQEYRIRTEAEQSTVERVAALVDQTMERIRRRTGTVDTLDLAVLAALNLANELLGVRDAGAAGAQAGGVAPDRLRALIQRAEAAVRNAGSAA